MKFTAALLLALPLQALATETFTVEQKQEIERIVSEERVKIRDAVIEEIKRNPSLLDAEKKNPVKVDPPDTPTATSFPGQGERPSADPRFFEYDAKSAAAPVPLDRGQSAQAPGVRTFKASVEFNEGGGRASIKLSEADDKIVGSSEFRSRLSVRDIVVSAPIDDRENGFANFATLDGLSSGFRVEYMRSLRYVDISSYLNKIASADFDAICKKYVAGGELNCSRSDVVRAINGDERAYAEFKKNFYPWVIDYAYSLQGSYDEFSYLTPSITKKSEARTGYGASASIGFLAPSRASLYALGVDYQKSYRPAKTAILCPPASGTQPVKCASGAFGAPKRTTGKLLWGEARGSLKRFGFSLRLTHDFESAETGVDLPIYLIRNKEGAWSGGVRLGWTNEQDFGAGIFISSPFEIK